MHWSWLASSYPASSRAVEKAQIEADRAQRRFMMVDPGNRLVVDTLEADWNQKLHVLVLTASNVNPTTFGFKFAANVTGRIYGQALYVAGLTEHNMVYAFDADNGAPIWSKALESPITLGIGTVFNPDCDGMSGGAATYEVGITSTPVIDPAAGLILRGRQDERKADAPRARSHDRQRRTRAGVDRRRGFRLQQLMYSWGTGSHLHAWLLTGGKLVDKGTNTEQTPGHLGGMITISSNATASGSGVLWANIPISGNSRHGIASGALYAFDASDITKPSL